MVSATNTPIKDDLVVGILGGFGPYATSEFFRRIVEHTPAETESDHLRVIIDSNPKAPSRTRAAIHGGDSPVPAIRRSLQVLEAAGVDFIATPCNSVHYFFDDYVDAVQIEVLDMLAIAHAFVVQSMPQVRRLAILGTATTVVKTLYAPYFDENHTRLDYGADALQSDVSAVIEATKQGRPGAELSLALSRLLMEFKGRGNDAALLACTELSLIRLHPISDLPVFDTMEIWARAVVSKAQSRGSR